MLAEMRIQGLGVIEDALLELHPGFTVVTGETGAGKTMVVTGLHLLSGGRAEVSKVRVGAGKALVEGRFEGVTGKVALDIIGDAGAEVEDGGGVIALRSVASDGRSRAHLGGRSVPVGVLGDLSEQLLAVHGQNDQLRLLRPAEQRAVIDRFAGDAVAGPLEQYRAVREEWQSVVAELTDRTSRSRELAQQADMLRLGLTEITSVEPVPGEDTELTEQIKRLSAIDELRATATEAHHAVSGAQDGDSEAPGALGLVGEAQRRLAGAEDQVLRDMEPRLAEAAVLLADVGTELGSYLESLEADPARLEQLLARQAELKKLIRKYAADIDGVLAWAEDARARLSTMDTSEEALGELAARRDELAKQLASHAARLSSAREVAAAELAGEITAELAGLAMGQAQIEVTVGVREVDESDPHALVVDGRTVHAGPDGVDEVELLLRAHKGAPPLPVHKAASGGELSRVMLAIEVVLAHADTVQTLVFDEVDAGVGGRAAVEIGRRLARLATSHQVLVVTHLPQVAAFADRHLVVDKGMSDGITRSGVKVLQQSERVLELARMLAGMDDTETGRAHAEELLAAADADKYSFTRLPREGGKGSKKKRTK
ncbi:DNA repair protein RecN [Amycolatopsis magusensis]|uniref:DNA repair protein RecN n=1 Tax=Amycolatopsis magusensis TaxID=882444 RepID=A0ABS4PTZ3_9PSEU|nr:DNA repair protein RecN [Amycolatopsis magusensis]MBP2182375.1 DNA repair protein RecN (Recombination protein N) [Amycolatopsis magusensis]MDI5982188.1 DNA repair protein RecN [Amycolatopsis magusensis]